MDRVRWNRIEELLQGALDLERDARAAFLSDACASDDDLRLEVEALLRGEDEAEVFSAHPAIAAFLPAVLHEGRQVSHYRVERRIGAGGMGEVYEARDEHLHRVVALKALPAAFTSDPDRVRRFEQEAFAASRLNHPNIITIFEIVHEDGAHYIAAERVDGVTLRELLRNGVTPDTALDVTIQVANALVAAHTAWIIHRDIKPENVMLRADGLVKVLDFGIAKLSDEDDAPPGAVLGTASYMSPEQRGGQSLDGRTDLFSLGIILHEMLTGARPATDGQPSKPLDGVPKELQQIVRRMLQPAREARYSSAGELLADLQHFKQRLESRSARTWVTLSAIAVVVALLLTALGAWLSVSEVWEERVLRDGHSAAVRQVAFSPDGRLLASCGEDGRVIVWNFAERRRVATFHDSAAKIAFSPDGHCLATGGFNGAIVIRDTRSNRIVRVLREHQTQIGSLVFSPDSSMLASASYDGTYGHSVLWNTSTWTKRHTWPFGGFGTFLFSPDVHQLLFSQYLAVFDIADGRELPNDVKASFNWAALSPDATQLAGLDSLGTLSFYRLAQRGRLDRRVLLSRRRAHQDHGRSIAFSPDGKFVATAAEDIVLWDAVTRQKIARFESPAIVWSVAFSPDGRWLVSSHADGAVLIWDVAERERVASLNEHSAAVRAVAFSPDGRTVASAGEDRTVTLWDARLGTKRAIFTDHTTRVTSVAFSRAGDLGSIDLDGLTVLRRDGAKRPRLTIPFTGGPGLAIAFAPDGSKFATSKGLYAADGRLLADFSRVRKSTQVYGVAFSGDGRLVACAAAQGYVMLWDAQTARLLGWMPVPGTAQISVSISPDGKWLVTGEDEGAVRLWSTSPLRQVAILGRHAARVKSVAFSPDGTTVASAGDDERIALWDVARRRLRTRIGTHTSPVYSVAFSPDGRQLVSGEHDHSVRLYTRRRTLWGISLD